MGQSQLADQAGAVRQADGPAAVGRGTPGPRPCGTGRDVLSRLARRGRRRFPLRPRHHGHGLGLAQGRPVRRPPVSRHGPGRWTINRSTARSRAPRSSAIGVRPNGKLYSLVCAAGAGVHEVFLPKVQRLAGEPVTVTGEQAAGAALGPGRRRSHPAADLQRVLRGEAAGDRKGV